MGQICFSSRISDNQKQFPNPDIRPILPDIEILFDTIELFNCFSSHLFKDNEYFSLKSKKRSIGMGKHAFMAGYLITQKII